MNLYVVYDWNVSPDWNEFVGSSQLLGLLNNDINLIAFIENSYFQIFFLVL